MRSSPGSRIRRIITMLFGAHVHRARMSLICLLVAAIPIVSSAAPSSGTPVVTNSCPPERVSNDVICPQPSGNGDTYIEYVYSDRATDAIAVKLTDAGLEKALTCAGAELITDRVIEVYAMFPRDERSRENIDWARTSMVDEIRAHAHLAKRPALLPTANPVEIDFRHYEGDFPASIAGLEKIGEQILFREMWACPASDG